MLFPGNLLASTEKVEQQEGGPGERVGAVRREGRGGGGGRRPSTVELDGKRHVDDHRDKVGETGPLLEVILLVGFILFKPEVLKL